MTAPTAAPTFTTSCGLRVTPVGAGLYDVLDPRGSGTPHRVTNQGDCDCRARQHRHRTCKHLDAVAEYLCFAPLDRATIEDLPPERNGAELAEGLEDAPPDDAPAPTPRFRLFTIDELLTLPPPTWLLAHHIPENSLAVLYGPPGAGKSFLALAWAMAIGAHQPWIQHATRWGPVVYVAAEGGSGLAQRAQAYRDSHELVRDCRIRFVREAVNLLEEREVSDLIIDVKAGIPNLKPALFVFDTMARCMAGGDENSAQDVGRVIAAADRIRQQAGAAVLLVHHTGKQGDGERGSSALRGAADCMFALRNDEGTLSLEVTKQKDAMAIEPRRLRLVPISDSCTVEPLEGHVPAAMTANGWKALRALMESFQGGESTVGVWQRVTGIPEGSFYRTLKQLLELDYVTKRGPRYVVSVAGDTALRSTLTSLSMHSHESSPSTHSHSGGPNKAPGERSGG